MFQLRLIKKYFWKSGILPITLLLNSLLIIIIVAFLYRNNILTLINVIPTLAALPLMSIGITFVPTIMIELKSSSFFQKHLLYISHKARTNFISFIYFFPIILVIYFIGFAMIAVINYQNLNLLFSSINWGELIFGIIVTIFISLFIGQMIFLFSNNIVTSQSISGVIFVIITILGGILLPITTIINIPVLNYLSYFNPFRYSTGIILTSWFANPEILTNLTNIQFLGGGAFEITKTFSILNINTREVIDVFNSSEKIANIFVPILFMLILLPIGIKKNLAKKFGKTPKIIEWWNRKIK